MRYLSVGAAVLFVLILGLRPELLQANDNDRSPTSILFLGSSYFGYNDLPGLFQALADSAGHDVYIDQRIPSGLYLSDHAASAETAALIQRQRWDYVVLQGVGRGTAYPESFTDHPVYPALATLCDMIHDNDASTQVVFCLPWAFEDGMTWYQGWDRYVCRDAEPHL